MFTSVMKNSEISLTFLASLLLTMSQSENYGGCRRNAAEFNTCVIDRLNAQRTKVKQGFPHLKVGSLDPLCVPKIVLNQGTGPVSIEVTSTDQIFRGISNYNINSANVNLQNFIMEFTASLPWLFVEGNTKMEGRVLVLPIKGSGYSWSNYTMVGAKAVLTGHPVQKGGKEHWSLDDVKFDMTVKQASLHLNNLFNGSQELGDAMNKLMAENWNVVYQELKPIIEHTTAAIVKDMAVKVFNYYSLDDMFPK